MTNCEHYIELISARLDGPLPPAEAEALDTHLVQCPHCRTLRDQLAGIHSAFSDLEEIPAPEGFTQNVMDEIRAQETATPKVIPLFRRPQVKTLASLAACAVLCVGLSGLLPKGATDNSGAAAGSASASNQSAASDPQRIIPGPGAAPNIALHDALGSDPQTSEEFPSDGTPQTDQVAGQPVSAILTLAALPEGAALDTQWLTDEEGRQVWFITPEQLEDLFALAQEQEIPAYRTYTSLSVSTCALVVDEDDEIFHS